MKVHLIFAPTTFPLHHGDLGKGIDPPLGILYIASYLRKFGPQGVSIKITDGLVEGYEKTLQEVIHENADIIGISAVTPNILGAYKLSNDIKKRLPSAKVILGGPHPTALPEEAFLRSNVDAVVVGEGEVTFTELVSFYHPDTKEKNSSDLSAIDGLCILLNDKPFRTGPRNFINDINSIPFPARDLIDMKKYSGYPIFKESPTTALLTSRGCPFNCTFCSNNVWRSPYSKFRIRSPKNIADEIEELIKLYGFKEFFDYSDEFNTNIKHTKEILKEIIKRKLSIHLKCQLRAKPIDDELAQLMKEAGVWYVHLGIESGNKETLQGIRKGISLEDVEQCCNILKKYNIKIWGLFMYFNVWERDGKVFYEDYEKSLNTFTYAKTMYKKGLIDYFGGSITTPVPGSELWDIAIRHALIKDECAGNWDMWYYKRDLRLVSRFPDVSEASIFKLHQMTVKYTIRSLLFGGLINLKNLRFSFLRTVYFLKRQFSMLLKRGS